MTGGHATRAWKRPLRRASVSSEARSYGHPEDLLGSGDSLTHLEDAVLEQRAHPDFSSPAPQPRQVGSPDDEVSGLVVEHEQLEQPDAPRVPGAPAALATRADEQCIDIEPPLLERLVGRSHRAVGLPAVRA